MSAPRGLAPFGVRARFFLLSIALIVVGLVGAQWYSSRALQAALDARMRDDLAARAELAAAAVEHARAFAAPDASELVDRLAAASRARVTLIDPQGRVVADSAVPGARLATLDNHADRPEVRAARAHGRGISDR